MIFSKRCPHQTIENYLIMATWWDLNSGRLYVLDDILLEMSTPGKYSLENYLIMVGFVLE
jgi:hypothetical protein